LLVPLTNAICTESGHVKHSDGKGHKELNTYT